MPLYKKGISLLSVVSKVIEIMLEKGLRDLIDVTLEDTQTGFKNDRNTSEWIFTVREMCENTTKRRWKY